MEQHTELLRKLAHRSPFLQTLGIEIVDVDFDRAVLRLPWAEHLVRNLDAIHGGAVAALIDTAGGAAVCSDYRKLETMHAATINILVNFLAPTPAGKDMFAMARVRKRGKTIAVADVDVQDEDGGLVATGTVTYKLGSKVGAKRR